MALYRREQEVARTADCEVCAAMGDQKTVDACKAERKAFQREPFLPPCFELGAAWYSPDNGKTWTREAPHAETRPLDSMTVTAINHDRGEVTMSVSK
jgi:hypothetical protein